MGLNIYVPCNCYKEGLCSDPPVDRNLIYLDKTCYLYELNLNYQENEKIFSEFDLWTENSCTHKGMKYFSDWVNTNIMVANFLDFIGSMDNKFELLYNTMIAFDKRDYVNSSDAKQLLEELNKLKVEMDLENLTKKYDLEEYSKYYECFYEMIKTLKKGCVASIETGNPLFFN